MNFEKLKKSEFWKNENNLLELKNHKNEKKTKISLFYTSTPKLMIIGYTVLEIWHMTDVIVVFQFGQFFALLPPQQPKKWKFQINNNTWRYHPFTQLYQNSWLYAILFLRYGAWQLYRYNCYFSFWVIFCPLTPLPTQKMKISKKWKKHQDIMILHKCTKAHDDTLCCSWDMVRDGCNCCCFFLLWAMFCPFATLTAQKMKFQKIKKYLEILSFYTIAPKIMITSYTVPEIWHKTDVIVIFHLGPSFALLPSPTPH